MKKLLKFKRFKLLNKLVNLTLSFGSVRYCQRKTHFYGIFPIRAM